MILDSRSEPRFYCCTWHCHMLHSKEHSRSLEASRSQECQSYPPLLVEWSELEMLFSFASGKTNCRGQWSALCFGSYFFIPRDAQTWLQRQQHRGQQQSQSFVANSLISRSQMSTKSTLSADDMGTFQNHYEQTLKGLKVPAATPVEGSPPAVFT